MVLKGLICFLIAINIKYIIKNCNENNLISYFTQESILELQYIKKGLQEVRNLVYFLYILIKLIFIQGNSDRNKIKRMPRAFRRYRSCLLTFFKILFSTFSVNKVFNSYFFRFFFFIFKVKSTNFLDFLIRCLILIVYALLP